MSANKRKESLDHSYTSDLVPDFFKNTVKPFFDCSEMIEEFWKMVRVSSYKHNFENNIVLITDIAIQSFKQTVCAMKKKTIAKPIAYFYGISNKKFEAAYLDEIAQMTNTSDHISQAVKKNHWLYASEGQFA